MSFSNVLVREFFNEDPFSSLPFTMPAPMPTIQSRVAPVICMNKITQVSAGFMLTRISDINPSVTMHRATTSMHNLNNNERLSVHRVSTDCPRRQIRKISACHVSMIL